MGLHLGLVVVVALMFLHWELSKVNVWLLQLSLPILYLFDLICTCYILLSICKTFLREEPPPMLQCFQSLLIKTSLKGLDLSAHSLI